jgi:PAS domain S-box-containing protein
MSRSAVARAAAHPAPTAVADQAQRAVGTDPLAPAALVVIGAEGQIEHVEGYGFPAHGLDTSGWRGHRIEEVLTAYMRRELLPRLAQALSGTPQSFSYVSQDGSRTYAVVLSPIRSGGDDVVSVVATAQDMTERVALAADAARSRDRLQEAERLAGAGSWELDVASGQATFTPGFARLHGIAPDEPLSLRSHRQLVHPADRDVLEQAGLTCLQTGSATCEHRIIRPDGEVRRLSLRAEMVPAPSGALIMRGAVLDITAQRSEEQQRLLAERQFRQAFDSAPIGMALSDPHTGRYLRVNDALCRMLDRPREALLATTIAAVSHPLDHPAVEASLREILAGERSEARHEKRYLRSDGSPVWGLLHLSAARGADGSVSALHSQVVDITERKAREERLEEEVADATWLGRIRDALDQDRFELHAQPIVDLRTGETVQHELLLRMRDVDGTIIAPGAFLPIAERYGLISEIDRWVVRQAVAIAAAGTAAEFNLSARSISDPAVLVELETALSATGADPGRLVVEITETALMAAPADGRAFATRIQQLGCRLALDDFGTGFSSLSYLKHLPADHLKIDIDFVRELPASRTDERVVRGIVGLAREFEQVTIAEGVEDEATLLKLRELGVDLAQGYLLGAPTPLHCPGGRGEPAPAGPAVAADPGCPGAPLGPSRPDDATLTVRRVFDAFAARDLDAMLALCRPDVVLRVAATSRRAGRDAPYRGRPGLQAYLRDVVDVWDRLDIIPREFRRTPDAVIAFGQVHAQRGAERISASVMWVARVHDAAIASIEVFQAVEEPPWGPGSPT